MSFAPYRIAHKRHFVPAMVFRFPLRIAYVPELPCHKAPVRNDQQYYQRRAGCCGSLLFIRPIFCPILLCGRRGSTTRWWCVVVGGRGLLRLTGLGSAGAGRVCGMVPGAVATTGHAGFCARFARKISSEEVRKRRLQKILFQSLPEVVGRYEDMRRWWGKKKISCSFI